MIQFAASGIKIRKIAFANISSIH